MPRGLNEKKQGKQEMSLQWHYAYSLSDMYEVVTVSIYGPFIKLERNAHGQVQTMKSFLDHEGKSYKTEAALEAHITKLVKKQHE